MTTKLRKRKRIQRKLSDLQKWQMISLAKFGGFSHKYITQLTLGEASESAVGCVSGYLHRNGVLVMNWRNGESSQAKLYAKSQMKPKRKIRIA